MTAKLSLVAQAAHYYQQGNFKQALHYYQQAAKQYGEHLFKANLHLCQQQLKGTPTPTSIAGQPSVQAARHLALQLQETQQLLEHYYNRTQELEYQLQDR